MEQTQEIMITKVDYSRLNALILRQLDENAYNLRELNFLNIEIKRARKIDSKKIDPDVVTMNSEVLLKFLKNGQTKTVKLVYPEKASFKDGLLSVLSPLGSAMLGYKKGDIVSFHSPGGIQTVRIDDILFQPEANGEDLD